MTATNEQFAAANIAWWEEGPHATPASAGRAMLAALQAHGCIPQQQGLTGRQQVVLQIFAANVDHITFEMAVGFADKIMELGQ